MNSNINLSVKRKTIQIQNKLQVKKKLKNAFLYMDCYFQHEHGCFSPIKSENHRVVEKKVSAHN